MVLVIIALVLHLPILANIHKLVIGLQSFFDLVDQGIIVLDGVLAVQFLDVLVYLFGEVLLEGAC